MAPPGRIHRSAIRARLQRSRLGSTTLAALLGLGAALPVAALLAPGCVREGCLAGDEGCVLPSPCQDLSFSCEARGVEVFIIDSLAQIPGGLDSGGAIGDVVLQNGRVTAVISAVDNPGFFGQSGGMLIDLVTRGDDNDQLTYSLQTMGLLPDDQAVYTRMDILPEEAGVRAIQVSGHLEGDENHRIYTRYEIRPCEPGIRVRTEVINNGDEDMAWAVVDGFYWSRRSLDPFTPILGTGFNHPSFGLGSVNDVIHPAPWMATSAYNEPGVGYAVVGCNVPEVEGLQSGFVSLIGLPRRLVAPRDYDVYERFIGAAKGLGVAGPAQVALEVRKQLFDEDYVQITGTVVLDGGRPTLGEARRATVHISAGSLDVPKPLWTPWTTAVPDAQGNFTAWVPASQTYVAEVIGLGRKAAQREFSVGDTNASIGELRVDATGSLTLEILVDGESTEGQVIVYPADQQTYIDVSARWNDYQLDNQLCAPLLGSPYGASPACNRVLTSGQTTIDIPPGTYDLFATRGPFVTLGRTRVEVNPGGTASATFNLASLPVLPPSGALDADFHVHGAKSFDTNVPDHTRVWAMLASGLQVIAATDHESIWDYAEAMRDLPTENRLVLLPGLETTGHALFNFNPAVTYPQVVGHYNFWPLDFDDSAPRNGAAYAERAEPGMIFTRMRASGLTDDGVIQLNHPWTEGEFGRDFGFPFALGLNLTDPLPLFDDGTSAGVFVRRPPGAELHNHDHHTQEVMNGTDNGAFFGYRAFWFYLLNQGIFRAGTANSDSHSLSDNLVGTPRTVVFTATQIDEDFDVSVFNADVRAGHMIGTNGPVIRARVLGDDGIEHGPSLTPFPANDARTLDITVTAAPWVPVDEIRVYVNGRLSAFVRDGLQRPADPLGTEGVLRFDGQLPLGNLLPPGDQDSWIVVEAGAVLPTVGDIDCNGVPDTSDNNGDGVVDWRDVDRDGDGDVDDDDLDVNGDGTIGPSDQQDACAGGPVGPLNGPPAPDQADDEYNFFAVTPGGYPLSFTNPLIIDRDGDPGFDPPGVDIVP